MASKNDNAMQARALAQQQVAKKERKSTIIIVVASVLGIALFAALIYFITDNSKVPALDADGAVVPAGSDATGGIPVGPTGIVGVDVPTDVPRVDIYEDFMCPACGKFEEINSVDLNELREASKISVYYHPITILDRYSNGTEFSTRAVNAVATVADRAPESFHPYVEVLYANQPAENTDGLTDEQLADFAVSVGVSQGVADQIVDGDFRKWALGATDQASQDGMQGTPTVMVDGEILDQNDVSYFTPGVLRNYLDSL